MKRPVKLSVVRDERARFEAKGLRRKLYCDLKDIVKDAGDDIAGYALVVWDKRGVNWSNFKPGYPILSRIVPTFAGDALTQHVTADMVRRDK